MITIPKYDESYLPCVIVDGYSTQQEPSKRYLGGVTPKVPKPRINLTLVADTDIKLTRLADFYYNTINGGTAEFKMLLPFEGIRDYWWTVKIVSNFDTNYLSKNLGEKKIMVELQDSIAEQVADGLDRQNIIGAMV